MQYVLTEQEYQELLDAKEKAEESEKKRLQEVCTLAADSIPVKVYWDKEGKQPWGCLHTREKEDGMEWYCDGCPVREFCPSRKRYSK